MNPNELFLRITPELSLPANHRASLLDLGCGAEGPFLLYVIQNNIPFKSIIAIDKSPQIIKKINLLGQIAMATNPEIGRKYKSNQIKDIITFYEISIEDFEFERFQYEFVIASNSLHFIEPTTRTSVIARIFASLVTGGLFYLEANHEKTPRITERADFKISENHYKGSDNEGEKEYFLYNEDNLRSDLKDYKIIEDLSDFSGSTFQVICKKI